MKLSEKQAIILFDIAKGSLCIANEIGGYNIATRSQIVNEILNQQSDVIQDLEHKPC